MNKFGGKKMNFLEAVKEMKQGKEVRRHCSNFYLKKDKQYTWINMGEINIAHLEATDWEIVEEKVTLSSHRHTQIDGRVTYAHYPEDKVKASIKEFLKLIAFKDCRNGNDCIIYCAKEIFGDDLIE